MKAAHACKLLLFSPEIRVQTAIYIFLYRTIRPSHGVISVFTRFSMHFQYRSHFFAVVVFLFSSRLIIGIYFVVFDGFRIEIANPVFISICTHGKTGVVCVCARKYASAHSHSRSRFDFIVQKPSKFIHLVAY